ncbi:MAG: hypothetical protein KF752_16995 [Pirellulaceae bacterium]|nr:hypothetical protein [Pirellulaceae bacterium]
MMNPLEQLDLDADDRQIIGLLNAFPVPASARQRAHQRLSQLLDIDQPDVTCGQTLDDAVRRAVHPVSSPDESGVQPATTTVQNAAEGQSAQRRLWLGLAAVAASLLLGWVTIRAWQPVPRSQLVAICAEQLSLSDSWDTLNSSVSQSDTGELDHILSRFLNASLTEAIQFRAMHKTKLSASGRLWKVLLSTGRELYIFQLSEPRPVEGVVDRLQLVADRSSGWSTAAIVHAGQLFVFMSKDDLRQTLRLAPLA